MNRGQLVSIIITTKNEQDVIRGALDSIGKQTYRKIEIIVVDNNSSDKTSHIAKIFTNKVFNFGPERSAQRNFGAEKAQGSYFLFLDADMQLTKNVVKECIELMQNDEKIGAINIPEISIGSNFWENIKAYERSFYNKEGDIITDAARFFKREVFEKIKGYDEKITGPEDWDITDRVLKNGFKIGRVEAKIYHLERIPSLFSLLKKKFYYGLDVHKYLGKQKISIIGPKTIYFLRPSFYKNPNKIFSHPILFVAMFMMLFAELLAGGFGYLLGKIKKL